MRGQGHQGHVRRGHRAQGFRLLQDRLVRLGALAVEVSQHRLGQVVEFGNEQRLVEFFEFVVDHERLEVGIKLRLRFVIHLHEVRCEVVRPEFFRPEVFRLEVFGFEVFGFERRLMTLPSAQVGVFGGSGFYSFLDDAHEVTIETPWGPTSAPITIGRLGDTDVAFIARHGRHHQHLPHEVPARANLWAMRVLGVRRIIGPCTVGSLRVDYAPADFVVLDQIVDRTWGRPSTFFDRGGVFHLPFADPYCPSMRNVALAAGNRSGVTMHDGGTVVVIPGPRFSTRAESRWYREQGWDVVNMTQHPEAALAAELGMCYCGIALVTDYDAGVDDDPSVEPVTMEQVFAFFEGNISRVREVLYELIPALGGADPCACVGRAGPIDSLPND